MSLKIRNEVKVGITVLLAIIVAIIGFRFMRDVPVFRQSMVISAEFEKSDGISNGSLVYIRGVRVGSVRNIELTREGSVMITMSIDTEIDIPKESVATITSLSIVEGKSIVIELGSSEEFVEYGGKIEGVYAESMMEVIGQKGDEIGDDISSTLSELSRFIQQLNYTLDDENRDRIDQTISGTAEAVTMLSETLERKQGEIENAIGAGSRMLQQLDTLAQDTRPKADSLMAAIERNMQELERVQAQLEITLTNLDEILLKINSGEGTLGKLVNDPSMYNNLDSLTVELNALIRGINENPGHYLKHMSIIDLF